MVEVPNHYSLLLQVSLLLFALPLLEWSGHQDGIYTFSTSSQHSLQKEVQESRGVLSDIKMSQNIFLLCSVCPPELFQFHETQPSQLFTIHV